MNTLKLAALLLVLGTVIALPLSAQDSEDKPIREIGVGTYNLSNNFNLIYKKELEENKYRRYDASVNFNFNKSNNDPNAEQVNTSFSFTLSTENRKYLNEKFKFVHGLFYGLGISLYSINDQMQTRINPQAGYQLGVQYDINDQFYVGAATFPGVSLGLSFDDNDAWISHAGLSFSPAAEVSVIYRF
ncbi:hypothetical protein [Catalinimonas niigatensis]|uniref:hypothetical protein n=1 Tax=Catalinimonas niigatensis TaxID=1397264 RepID=UPI002665B1B9|nr:hypothetical protein [Catalinimonas niigatensis]WPP49365.1 hypothetical protein PZB72_22095 [Catalinimonas niigatensis]